MGSRAHYNAALAHFCCRIMPYFHATLRIWRALAFQRQHAKFYSRSHDAVIRVYDEAGNVIETHEHKGDFREP